MGNNKDNKNQIEKALTEYSNIIKNYISGFRYNHSVSVANCAMSLAMRYEVPLLDALIAGMLHDIAKKIKTSDMIDLCKKYNIELSDDDKKSIPVVHSYLGAYIAEHELNITNKDILNAIYNHTLGRAGMSMLEKIIFVADYIEPLRSKRENMDEIRKIAFIDIDKCIVLIIDSCLKHLNNTNTFIHSKMMETYEYYKNITRGN